MLSGKREANQQRNTVYTVVADIHSLFQGTYFEEGAEQFGAEG
jgi:hypothetical protein